MKHRHPRTLLTPAMSEVLDRMARVRRMPVHQMPVSLARQTYEAGSGVLDVPPQRMARSELPHIPTRDGAMITARLVAPSAEKLPLLVYFHGGGFTIGSTATHDALCRALAHQAHCAVLSVEYRLAPEWKFPTACNDAWDALVWARIHGESLGIDSQRIAVGGDSAGGTLATVCAIMARDHGLPLALQMLFYPGCSSHQEAPSHQTFAKGFVLEQDSIQWFFGHYLRSDADRMDWRFAPLHADDLEGCAPTWIGLAECDPLVDEGMLYADRLQSSAVEVDLEIYRGMVHEFIKMGKVLPEARQCHQDAARALRKAFLPKGSPP
jgi:acetyl esterase